MAVTAAGISSTAAGDLPALKQVDLEVDAGELVAVIGKSRSGKSTLVNMITGIDRPIQRPQASSMRSRPRPRRPRWPLPRLRAGVPRPSTVTKSTRLLPCQTSGKASSGF